MLSNGELAAVDGNRLALDLLARGVQLRLRAHVGPYQLSRPLHLLARQRQKLPFVLEGFEIVGVAFLLELHLRRDLIDFRLPLRNRQRHLAVVEADQQLAGFCALAFARRNVQHVSFDARRQPGRPRGLGPAKETQIG